jgi:hypothetical protein
MFKNTLLYSLKFELEKGLFASIKQPLIKVKLESLEGAIFITFSPSNYTSLCGNASGK